MTVRPAVGWLVGMNTGGFVGPKDALPDGSNVLGPEEGFPDGMGLRKMVGWNVGSPVDGTVGVAVGPEVGFNVGDEVQVVVGP